MPNRNGNPSELARYRCDWATVQSKSDVEMRLDLLEHLEMQQHGSDGDLGDENQRQTQDNRQTQKKIAGGSFQRDETRCLATTASACPFALPPAPICAIGIFLLGSQSRLGILC